MKATFSDFVFQNQTCKKFHGNPDAMHMFEILSKDENIISMVDASEANKPALMACVHEIEDFFDSQPNSQVDLKDDYTRTVIGRMVKTILAPFGYEPSTKKDMPKALGAKYFTSAMNYKKTGSASMHIVRKVEEI